MQTIYAIIEDSHQSYGSPRMAVELEKCDFKASSLKTARRIEIRIKKTTNSIYSKAYIIFPNFSAI